MRFHTMHRIEFCSGSEQSFAQSGIDRLTIVFACFGRCGRSICLCALSSHRDQRYDFLFCQASVRSIPHLYLFDASSFCFCGIHTCFQLRQKAKSPSRPWSHDGQNASQRNQTCSNCAGIFCFHSGGSALSLVSTSSSLSLLSLRQPAHKDWERASIRPGRLVLIKTTQWGYFPAQVHSAPDRRGRKWTYSLKWCSQLHAHSNQEPGGRWALPEGDSELEQEDVVRAVVACFDNLGQGGRLPAAVIARIKL